MGGLFLGINQVLWQQWGLEALVFCCALEVVLVGVKITLLESSFVQTVLQGWVGALGLA